MDVDALTLVLCCDRVLDHGIEGPEEVLMSNEKVRFAAKVVERTRHFNSDIACTNQCYTFG